jgi:hypothetical protein
MIEAILKRPQPIADIPRSSPKVIDNVNLDQYLLASVLSTDKRAAKASSLGLGLIGCVLTLHYNSRQNQP